MPLDVKKYSRPPPKTPSPGGGLAVGGGFAVRSKIKEQFLVVQP